MSRGGGRSNRISSSRVEQGRVRENSSPSGSRQETTNPTRESESQSENATPSSSRSRAPFVSGSNGSSRGLGQGGLPVAYVYGGRLFPDSVASTCWKIFQKKMDAKGYNWKAISTETKESYFQEFKKLYTCPEDQESIIKKHWTEMASGRYSDMISRLVKKRRFSTKPEFIMEADWPGWLAYWDDDKVKHNAEVNSKNRRTEIDGAGTGYSLHSCGSKSALSHFLDMTKANGGVEPPLYEFHRKIHTSKKTNDWVDPKAKRIYEKVQSEIETMKQRLTNSQGETEGSTHTVPKDTADTFFVEAAGGIKKRRIYGLGDVGSSIVSTSQSAATQGTSSSTIDEIISQKMESERAEMNNKLRESNEKMEQQSIQLESQSIQLKSQGEKIEELSAMLKQFMESMNR